MKIGIIGGGQLGKMLAISASKKDYKTISLDPSFDCPSSIVSDEVIVSDYGDLLSLELLLKEADVVTYEFENIPFDVIKEFEKKYNIPQGYRPLYYSQHRLREKNMALSTGLKTVPFIGVNSIKGLNHSIKLMKYPLILKTCTLGYDGKNQVKITSDTDLIKAYELVRNNECILEKMIDFDCEISVIVVRNKRGQVVTLPIPKNIHKNGILHMSILPNGLNEHLNEKAKKLAVDLMKEADFVGILAVEMFVKDNEIYFNEMAPRPHNSGHYSIEGCNISQFDLAIKAILNEDLINPYLKQPTIMVNLLGQHMKNLSSFNEEDAFVHLYGKSVSKHNRKMGHITFINKSYEEVENILKKYWEL